MAEVLHILLSKSPGVCAEAEMIRQLYGADPSAPDAPAKVIKVHVHKLRKALTGWDIALISEFSEGYRLAIGTENLGPQPRAFYRTLAH